MRQLYRIVVSAIAIVPAATAVPLRISHGHVLVDQVYIDGAGPFRFVLDTGAQTSSVRLDVADRIGLKPAYRVENSSVGGTRYLPAGVAQRVSLGERTASGVELVVHDLAAMRLVDSGVEGVLGQNFLARFNYLLDVRGRRLSFEEGREGKQLPFTRVSDRMVVRSGDLSLVLDSGSGDLVLFHDRRDLRDTGVVMNAAAVSDARQVRVAKLPRLQVGERTWKNVPAAVIGVGSGDADGLLPLTLFDWVYVNNSGSYVVVR